MFWPFRGGKRRHEFGRVRPGVEALEDRSVPSATEFAAAAGTLSVSDTFKLHSNARSTHVVYLDFNGHKTGDVFGSAFDDITSTAWDLAGNGPSFTSSELRTIQKIWARVAEDFAPFDIDVTTQDPGLEALRKTSAADVRYGVRVVFTPDDTPGPDKGGVAFVGTFDADTDTPAYVFNKQESSAAEAASHEVGHTLGLQHDGTAKLEYFAGHGSGAISWGPIMGASYGRNVTQWSKGEYAGADNREDDLSIITTHNGLGYRGDDFADKSSSAPLLMPKGTLKIPATYGVIGRAGDVDQFRFYSGRGRFVVNVDPVPLGPNLAIRVDLYNAGGALLKTFNSQTALNAVVDYTTPDAGQFYIRISGASRGKGSTAGFTQYASLGNYRISGGVPLDLNVRLHRGVTVSASASAASASTNSTSAPATGTTVVSGQTPAGNAVRLPRLSHLVRADESDDDPLGLGLKKGPKMGVWPV